MPGISINIIRVGSDQFTPADLTTINNAITVVRNTYATVGLTLRRVEHYIIPTADARGRDVIDNDDEAVALTDEWTVRNNAIDIFVVRSYVGSVAGLSPVPGPCNKDAKGMDGVVMELLGNLSGLIMAHEMGHYMGLPHVNDSTNLMFPSVPNGGRLTAGQGNTVKSHCFIEA